MHGWIAFAGSDEVAAVQLIRTQPSAATPNPPWAAFIRGYAVPPTGWSMP
jgi:hypothetical protein